MKTRFLLIGIIASLTVGTIYTAQPFSVQITQLKQEYHAGEPIGFGKGNFINQIMYPYVLVQ